jgi:hypothetical protein
MTTWNSWLCSRRKILHLASLAPLVGLLRFRPDAEGEISPSAIRNIMVDAIERNIIVIDEGIRRGITPGLVERMIKVANHLQTPIDTLLVPPGIETYKLRGMGLYIRTAAIDVNYYRDTGCVFPDWKTRLVIATGKRALLGAF